MHTTLFRPIGVKELELILQTNSKEFPPRLDWQPIFYPVLNEEYAIQIARDWNTKDEGSGYAGFVTRFQLPTSYLDQFTVENVGGSLHEELWIPAEELPRFNQEIDGNIEVIAQFLGENYSSNIHLQIN